MVAYSVAEGCCCREVKLFFYIWMQGAKKVGFTACHSESLLSSQKKLLMSTLDYSSSVIWISQKTLLSLQAS